MRPSKRSKTTNNERNAVEANLTLPPVVWASIMEYLPLSNTLSLSSTCKTIYKETTPLVKMIHITESSDIDCRLCKRFRGVTDIFIYSLVKLELVTIFGDEGVIAGNLLSIDHETTIRSVPFLSMMMMGLPKLERVFFGGVSNDQAQVFDGDDSDEDSDDDERGGENKLVPYVDYPDRDFIFQDEQPLMTGLIDSMAGAFKVGALSPNLIIKGLRCLNDGNEECQACRHACESFPLESVACFECRGSSKDQIKSGRSFDLDVCLKREEVVSNQIFFRENSLYWLHF